MKIEANLMTALEIFTSSGLGPSTVSALSWVTSPVSRPLQPAELYTTLMISLTSSLGSRPRDGVSAHAIGVINSACLLTRDSADVSINTNPSVVCNLLLFVLIVYFEISRSLRLSHSPDVVIIRCHGLGIIISCAQLFIVDIGSATCPVSSTRLRRITGRRALILAPAHNEIQHRDEVINDNMERHCFMYLHTSGCDDSLIATDDCLNDHGHMTYMTNDIIYAGPGLHRSAPHT